MIPLAQSRYPAEMTAPMQQELADAGFTLLHSKEEVDSFLATPGTKLVVVNSVCGCAAGSARPGIVLATQNQKFPSVRATVFAGVDNEATQRFREYVTPSPPSSPSIFLMDRKKCVFTMPRSEIEGKSPEEIAQRLGEAFQSFVLP
ncbi:MAG: BrxA/BrxB family bacilliredoxin [Candidatus Diapherotrites archaeon]|nr:BrxA/BrxB family bacilliredoxin [Candidatus Diapherotrites archaeon]MDZ4255973.1 BrxA/BrxB family bacilliredoxin [archaeon]